MKTTAPLKIAEIVRGFVSSPAAEELIKLHRKEETRMVSVIKERIATLATEEIEFVIGEIAKFSKRESSGNFIVHNVRDNNVRIEITNERDDIKTRASVDSDYDLFVQIELNKEKSEGLLAGICGCISERYDLNDEVQSLLDEMYPKESGLIIIIKGNGFRFENTYGG